ncbi:tenascin-like [Macrosteles quadrilineatus]|uniref:tenascin-like n=1 Tax=Macrosteles quadrilineatus TaxID=74068 RepID=UPI0023E1DB50|nr:tenascin-like [Macrosteles quadrilineatus]
MMNYLLYVSILYFFVQTSQIVVLEGEGVCRRDSKNIITVNQEEDKYTNETELYCCEGYMEHLSGCTPVCESGKCVAHSNYTLMSNQTTSISEPKPNLPQTCDEGFHINNGACEPICSRPCKNGYCSTPNNCTCYEGYTKSFWDSYKCSPVCSPPCVNGICSMPQFCECEEGYYKNKVVPHICGPFCSHECINGYCSSPGKCTCKPGYKSTDYPGICEPICSKKCVNGYCDRPEYCECYWGFRKDPFMLNKCTPCISKDCGDSNSPVCSKECVNGKCIASETCECLEGYQLGPVSHICVPVCSDCEYGACVAPDTCICFRGYTNPSGNYSTCVPRCEEPCVNAECIGPNECSCSSGYVKDVHNNNICSPKCSKCVNGYCLMPEQCLCFLGYEPNEELQNVCDPFCSVDCNNGICVQPDICECFWGFTYENISSQCVYASNTTEDLDFSFEFTSKRFLYSYQIDIGINRSYFLQRILKKLNSNYLLVIVCTFEASSTLLDEDKNNFLCEMEKRNKNITGRRENTKVISNITGEIHFTFFINFTLFIKNEKITVNYLNGTSYESDSLMNWCACFDKRIWTLQVNDEIEFHLCPCNQDLIYFIPGSDDLLLAYALLGTFMFLLVISPTLIWKTRRKRSLTINRKEGAIKSKLSTSLEGK